jgi:hypothetical protein
MILRFSSPWNLGTETSHIWSVGFSLSGAAPIPDASIETTALDLFEPIRQISGASGFSYLAGWSYYHSGSTVAYASATYTSTQHQCTHIGVSASGAFPQQLEVCVLARCPVGKSIKGREVYLRKWIHDVFSAPSDANSSATVINPTTTLAKWNTGSGPNLNVPVDPTGGAQGGPWVLEHHLFTHQLRRGAKRKSIPPPNPI